MRTARDVFLGMAVTLLLSGCTPVQKSHPLLSKRISVPDQNDQIINLHDLRSDMREYVAAIPERIGVYFEYLPSGGSIGVHEEQRFIAASLLKVPLVIEAYAMKNRGIISFDDVLTLEQQDIDTGFGVLWKKGVGSTLNVRQDVDYILTQSDNTARSVLLRYMAQKNPNYLDEAFDDLDMPKEIIGDNPVVSAENYSSILRSLYLASSLPKGDAAEILTLLTQSPFVDKMPAGLPPGVTVAHKIGEYNSVPGQLTFSDCGIVYVPKRPFLLCVIVQADEELASMHIRELTRMAYDFIAGASVPAL